MWNHLRIKFDLRLNSMHVYLPKVDWISDKPLAIISYVNIFWLNALCTGGGSFISSASSAIVNL
jgi:hypothetical protein